MMFMTCYSMLALLPVSTEAEVDDLHQLLPRAGVHHVLLGVYVYVCIYIYIYIYADTCHMSYVQGDPTPRSQIQ